MDVGHGMTADLLHLVVTFWQGRVGTAAFDIAVLGDEMEVGRREGEPGLW